MNINEILTAFKNGEMSVEQAEIILKDELDYEERSCLEVGCIEKSYSENCCTEAECAEAGNTGKNISATDGIKEGCRDAGQTKSGYTEMGYAKFDSDRRRRTGFAEVVFCSGKTIEQLRSIYQHIFDMEGEVLGTRATREQYEALTETFPDIYYDELSRILKLEKKDKVRSGNVAVCSAGTADIPIAEEAAQTAEFFGTKVNRIYDIGVSGIHRLLSKTDELQSANCVVAAAGMEGALPSVLGGLVRNPVIAVPTSVGYGASFHGLSALLTMINSCANGIAVVNIDNGYGAGYLAAQMNRLALGCLSKNCR